MPSETRPDAGQRLLGMLSAGTGPFPYRGGVYRLLGTAPRAGARMAAPPPLPPVALRYENTPSWPQASSPLGMAPPAPPRRPATLGAALPVHGADGPVRTSLAGRMAEGHATPGAYPGTALSAGARDDAAPAPAGSASGAVSASAALPEQTRRIELPGRSERPRGVETSGSPSTPERLRPPGASGAAPAGAVRRVTTAERIPAVAGKPASRTGDPAPAPSGDASLRGPAPGRTAEVESRPDARTVGALPSPSRREAVDGKDDASVHSPVPGAAVTPGRIRAPGSHRPPEVPEARRPDPAARRAAGDAAGPPGEPNTSPPAPSGGTRFRSPSAETGGPSAAEGPASGSGDPAPPAVPRPAAVRGAPAGASPTVQRDAGGAWDQAGPRGRPEPAGRAPTRMPLLGSDRATRAHEGAAGDPEPTGVPAPARTTGLAVPGLTVRSAAPPPAMPWGGASGGASPDASDPHAARSTGSGARQAPGRPSPAASPPRAAGTVSPVRSSAGAMEHVEALRGASARRAARPAPRAAEPARADAPREAPRPAEAPAPEAPRIVVVRPEPVRAASRSFWSSSTLRSVHFRVLR